MVKSFPMKTPLLLSILFSLLVSSCASNDEFQDRMDKRNDAYSNYNERRKIRLDARQERTDMWFDRAMH
jgi:hypothetical protein